MHAVCAFSLCVCTKSVSLKLVISSILFSHFPFPCDDQLHTSYSTRNMQHVTALVVIVLVLLLPLLLLLLLLYAMLLSSNTKCPLNVSDHTWLLLSLCVWVCVWYTIDWKNINITVSSVSLYVCVCVCRVHRRVYCHVKLMGMWTG